MIIVGVKRCAERITTGHYARNLLLLEELSTICAKVVGTESTGVAIIMTNFSRVGCYAPRELMRSGVCV